jgi:hypothetical protein
MPQAFNHLPDMQPPDPNPQYTQNQIANNSNQQGVSAYISHIPHINYIPLVLQQLQDDTYRPIRLAYQPPVSSTFLSEQTNHQQPASSTFLSEQINTSH